MKKSTQTIEAIRIRGARQNNLKNLNVDFTPGTYTVITGPSGSGKSSLAFDTLYAEGQRRYVETFSAYARQFLERCDKPEVDSIEGVPPAIAINQTNTVRTSRSTVGTMTEINDHLKLLFARKAKLYCPECGNPVEDMTSQRFWEDIQGKAQAMGDPRLVITFDTLVPDSIERQSAIDALAAQGFSRIHGERKSREGLILTVSVDRFRASKASTLRATQAIETALASGRGRFAQCFCVHALDETGETLWPYSKGLKCARCERSYTPSSESLFSFNSAVGACPTCRGFGRIISIDPGLVIPDPTLSLARGAIKPWRGGRSHACQNDMMRFAKRDGIRTNVPFVELTAQEKHWVFAGEPGWTGQWSRQWYGVDRYFSDLEKKSYKMHVRVLLARYRSYVQCPTCRGARLRPEALNWRVGDRDSARSALGSLPPFKPEGIHMTDAAFEKLPGLTLHDITLIPIARLVSFFDALRSTITDDPGLLVLDEIRSRLGYLVDVGLGYLTLDRQSRTLSGGEVQRVNLTTALGTRLVDTLFVLDEPSVGLHPRDMDRVNGILGRLKNAGNTLIVVEHDPQVMLEADRILDMGPQAGKLGGQIVFDGTPTDLLQSKSLTGLYLSGRLSVDSHITSRAPTPRTEWIELEGAHEHNLKGINAAFPLEYFTTVTGVSGSGKSTLVMDTLVPALQRHLGVAASAPKLSSLKLDSRIKDLHILDQSSLGKSTRVTPASFVGVLKPLRECFSRTPLAIARSYTPEHFSFNNAIGRCPTCEGAGFERVEMQFLSDVLLRCPDCDGKRFRPEILEVTINLDGKGDRNIADILDMTVDQAMTYFRTYPSRFSVLALYLKPLQDVGLGYLQLGQSVTTLSGGEAQRLRLAALLTGVRSYKGHVFVLDEPTTGLHFDDVAKLLQVLRKLIAEEATVIVVEHNLDVMLQSDWIIDLGPDGGDAGGEIVVAGTPERIMATKASLTGRAMRAYSDHKKPIETRMRGIFNDVGKASAEHRPHGRSLQSVWRQARAGDIGIFGAREHNLKNFDAVVAKNALTAVTGVSGSGKSTFAFGIVFSEGQRRYLESLNAYARSIVQPNAKPDVESVVGISPTVAIEQRTSRGGRKSTVATLTEIQHFLRLLYVRLGVQYCPNCHEPVTPQSSDAIFEHILRKYRQKTVRLLAPLVTARKGIYTELAVWALGQDIEELRVDGEWVSSWNFPQLARYKEHTIEMPVASLRVDKNCEGKLREAIGSALSFGKGVFSVLCADKDGLVHEQTFSTLRACPTCHMSFPEPDPRLFSYNSKLGWCPTCFGTGRLIAGFDAEQSGEESVWAEASDQEQMCPDCQGMRLNAISRSVIFAGRSICETTALSVTDCIATLSQLRLRGREKAIGEPALKEILSRLNFLESVGLGYLALDRDAPSLSGGEAQRIRLASQLGSTLQGICYVLDEPTIGLHPRDNKRLIDNLLKLRDKGNTVLVVEHDEETIRRADYVIDVGPGAGSRGGKLIAEGELSDIMKVKESVTGYYLKHPLAHTGIPKHPVKAGEPRLRLKGACAHNLHDLSVDIPLGRLVALTGVSGSGKSTLARDVLLKNIGSLLDNPATPCVGIQSITGFQDTIGRVLEVDQSPIGKTIRSCPATYIGLFNAIRKLYAETAEAQANGWDASFFSFNTGAGRCPICQGQGDIKVEMSFLPDVRVPCDGCHGMRFAPETLTAIWMGKSIGEVLDMSVDEAVDFFEPMPSIAGPLMLMRDVGLGYLKLGQPSSTLSGGEAQRIKLVTELAKAHTDAARRHWRTPRTLYILDEPTVGLHMADVGKLIDVLHRLVDAGNTVLVVEHNLDVIAEADHIIDLGPEGGPEGGRIVGEGTPIQIASLNSATGQSLREFLAEHRPAPATDR